ncbi:MAG TPA: patatin-like phospholipase family protein [Streptosporangiaceae bacterium]|jgi:NTE family protein
MGNTRFVGERALVLGSGGLTGIAWELGLLAGLAGRGIDLTGADLVVGTSAGSVVGAQITSGAALAELYQAQLAPPNGAISASMSWQLQLRYLSAVLLSRNATRARLRLGRISLGSPPLPEEVRREVIAARLPVHDWPAQRLLITAVDADTGEWTAFSAADDAGLIEAVAASCAVPGVWPPVRINGRRWMDGGMRSSANADLAAGYERVVVLAPIAQGFRALPSAARQSRALTASGHTVALITPDRTAQAAVGGAMLDATRAAAAARAGQTQAASAAEAVAKVWAAGTLAP